MRIILSLVLMISFCVSAAQATTIVWKDPHTGLSVSYPDVWVRVPEGGQESVLKIVSPWGGRVASCEFTATPDHRFAVYPHRYDFTLHQNNFAKNYWTQYMAANSRGYDVKNMHDMAGIGRSYATAINVEYYPLDEISNVAYRAFVFTGVYDGLRTTAMCRANARDWAAYAPVMRQILAHVQHTKTRAELLNGDYRAFQYDGYNPWYLLGLGTWFDYVF